MENKLIVLDIDNVPMDTEFYEIRLYAKGIRKRCRKVEFKGYHVAHVPLNIKGDKTALAELRVMARKVIEDNLKEIIGLPSMKATYGKARGCVTESHPFSELNFSINIEEV